MWGVGVLVVAVAAVTFFRFFRARDDAPPMERHSRALQVLRDLSEHPRPLPDLVTQPESTTDHVRILEDAPAAPNAGRRPATRSRRTARTGATRSAKGRSGTQPPAAELPIILIRPISDGVSPPVGTAPIAAPLAPEPDRDPDAGAPPRMPRARKSNLPARVYGGAGSAVVVLATIGIVVGAGVGGGAGKRGTARVATTNNAPSGPSVQSPVASTTMPMPTVPVPAPPVVSLTTAGATVTVHSPFRLTLHATGTCWVEVTDPTGKALFATTMHAGQDQVIPAAQAIVVRLGYTPAVTISVDGVAIDLGRLSQTANVNFRTA